MHKDITEHFIEEGDKNKISEVIVFSRSAYLKRHVIAQTQLGVNRFYIELNAFRVDADSVQSSVYGDGEILSVQYKKTPVLAENIKQANIKALEMEKRQLIKEYRILEYKSENCKKQKVLLNSLIGIPETPNKLEFKSDFPDTNKLKNTLENLKVILELLNQNYAEITQQEEDIVVELQKIIERQQVVVDKLQKLGAEYLRIDNSHKTIEIVFNAKKSEQINIEVSYKALDATWKPVYKIDASLDLKQIDITLFAHIEQKTGEDWQDVKLSFSNVLPIKATSLPELYLWQVRAVPLFEEPPQATRSAPAAAPALYASNDSLEMMDADMATDFKNKEATFSQAQLIKSPNAFEYQLPELTDINSGDDESILPILNKQIDGQFFYYTVPKKDLSVYLVCEANLDNDLLYGQMNIHFGGRFVGKTVLDEKKAGKPLLINLGADNEVKIQREKITDQLTESFLKGMIDRLSIERKLDYRIIIENLKSESVRVKIIDAIPVPNTDRIQMKDVGIKPEPNERDWQKRNGVMLWDIQLPAKTSKEIYISFTIKYPKDYKIEL